MPPETADPRRAALLSEALHELEQGYAVFDEHFRLVAWNERFFALHDFPLELAAPGVEYRAFVTLFAERGDYGPGEPERLVAWRLAGAARHERIQIDLAKPGGRVIEAVGRHLPSGGVSVDLRRCHRPAPP